MDLFNNSIIDLANNHISLCEGYELLYRYILKYSKNNPDHKIITIGGDHSISTGTISAINEKYLRQLGNNCYSDLIVLWIDTKTDLFDFNNSENKDLSEMSMASLLGLCGNAFTKNKLLLKSQQIIYYGLDENDENLNWVKENGIVFFTNKKIKTLNLDIIINFIKNMIGNKPVHISLDMKAFDKSLAPSVIPQTKEGLNNDHIEKLLLAIKKNIVSMDIVEFNPCIGNSFDVKITRETARYILMKIFDIKEKNINIFTEDSQFLIYRSLSQIDIENDYGWYILRGLTLKQKEEIIKNIKDDLIISIDIEDSEDLEAGTYLISKTTINEQNEKSYYTSHFIEDTVLFPQEKILMTFELINS